MIKVVAVKPAWRSFMDGDGRCVFCRKSTDYVFYPEWISVCRECAREHDREDLPKDPVIQAKTFLHIQGV